jgi:hypothetical protein
LILGGKVGGDWAVEFGVVGFELVFDGESLYGCLELLDNTWVMDVDVCDGVLGLRGGKELVNMQFKVAYSLWSFFLLIFTW